MGNDASEKKDQEERIRESGQVTLGGGRKGRIHLLSIIGEIEGHENLSGSTKTTKYEHILPELAKVEDDPDIDGILMLINTVGGDVSCGLALAEMLASLSKPTVSLVIGDSHSIGVPLAVASDYSFIVPTGTMMVHPVRMTGMVIGAAQTYDYFEMIQDRILSFVSEHSRISYDGLKVLMHNTKMLTRDLGTVLVGKDAVEKGLPDCLPLKIIKLFLIKQGYICFPAYLLPLLQMIILGQRGNILLIAVNPFFVPLLLLLFLFLLPGKLIHLCIDILRHNLTLGKRIVFAAGLRHFLFFLLHRLTQQQ